MLIDFPNNPTAGQTYAYAGQQWEYNGVAWDKLIIADDANALYGISGSIYASSLATGLLYGGILSINAGSSAHFDITAGKGQIHTSGSTYTSDPQPTFQYVTWPAQTGITLSYLATNDTTWIYVDSAGIVQQRTEYYTDVQLEENIIIGQLVHPSRTFINLARTNPNVAYATDKQYEQFIRSFGPIKISGHTIQPNGANLKLNRTSGSAFSLGRNWINDTDNPSVVTDGAQTDCIFYRYYRGATAGTFITVPNQTVIDPTKYDNGTGTLATVPGGKYTIQRLFYYPNTPTLLGVYYGRAEYTSLADAAANINFENFTEIENTRTNAIFVAYLLIKSGCTDITNTSDALILQGGNFRSTTSGGGSVSLTLDDLTDVIITSPQNYQVLTYVDGTTGWENRSVTSLPLVSSIRGLTGAVGITNGSGIGLSVSGQTMTFSNTGVLSVNGSTGSVVTYAGTTGNIQFRYNNGVTANNYFTLESGDLVEITDILSLSGPTSSLWYYGNQEAIGLQINRGYGGLGLDESGGVNIKVLGIGTDAGDIYASNLRISTHPNTAGGGLIILDAGGYGAFTVSQNGVLSTLIHEFGSGINSYNPASTNTFAGPINAAGATFSSLVRFNAGISSAGGTFSALTRFTAGISAAGGTFSGTQTFVNGATFQGNINAPNIVTSFNGSTGAIVGVNSVRGLTGAVGITNGSGIGLNVSGNTLTVSNTGVLSINGSTGAITNVARTNVDNNFSASQTIDQLSATLTVRDADLPARFVVDPSLRRIDYYNDDLLILTSLRFTNSNSTITLPNFTTTLAGLSGTQTFTGEKTFNALTNFPGGISAAGATFTGDINLTSDIYHKTDSNSSFLIQQHYSPAPGAYSPTTFINLGALGMALGYTGNGNAVKIIGGVEIDASSTSVFSSHTPLKIKGTTLNGSPTQSMTDWINPSNTVLSSILPSGGYSGPASSFSGLVSANAGISAAGATFSSLVRFNAGISAAGGITFNSDVTISSPNTLNASTIVTTTGKTQLDIDNRASARVAIGDYDFNGNGTNIFLRDGATTLELSNPYGVISIGDPNVFDTGYYIYYVSNEHTLYGNGGYISNFNSIVAIDGFYETANSIKVTNNARSWFL
jgi:hypothetical protein